MVEKNLYLAHNFYKAPFVWMTPAVWDSLQRHWESKELKKINKKNIHNRAENESSSTLIYRGGSISLAVHHLSLVMYLIHLITIIIVVSNLSDNLTFLCYVQFLY